MRLDILNRKFCFDFHRKFDRKWPKTRFFSVVLKISGSKLWFKNSIVNQFVLLCAKKYSKNEKNANSNQHVMKLRKRRTHPSRCIVMFTNRLILSYKLNFELNLAKMVKPRFKTPINQSYSFSPMILAPRLINLEKSQCLHTEQ